MIHACVLSDCTISLFCVLSLFFCLSNSLSDEPECSRMILILPECLSDFMFVKTSRWKFEKNSMVPHKFWYGAPSVWLVNLTSGHDHTSGHNFLSIIVHNQNRLIKSIFPLTYT